jgi:parallel beta-helix repeat protein
MKIVWIGVLAMICLTSCDSVTTEAQAASFKVQKAPKPPKDPRKVDVRLTPQAETYTVSVQIHQSGNTADLSWPWVASPVSGWTADVTGTTPVQSFTFDAPRDTVDHDWRVCVSSFDSVKGLASESATCSAPFTVVGVAPPPPDRDGDGIPDAEDPCPDDPTNTCNDPPAPPDTVIVGDCDATYTGGDLQSELDAAGTNAVVCVGPGNYAASDVQPLDGQTIRCDASVFTGTGIAFRGPGNGVTIDGCTVEGYDPRDVGLDLDAGAIHGDGTSGWTITGVTARNNAGTGIRIQTDWLVTDSHAHGNGNLGVGGFQADRSVVQYTEINGNGFAGRGGEHGGHKQVGSVGGVMRGNYVHDNTGRGIWFDTAIFDVLVEDNVVENNSLEGIWLENTCGPGVIRGNTVTGNGYGEVSGWIDKAGIQVVDGINIEITGNTVGGNQHQISLLAAPYPEHGCVPDLRNVHVHGNAITLDQGQAGAMSYQWPVNIYTDANLVWENNSYTITGGGFAWNGNIFLSLAQWQAYHPNDGN